MLCARPFRTADGDFGCGQCMPCRINTRRVWTGRLLFESLMHKENGVFTLTYSDDFVTEELQPRELQLFLKRLRVVSPEPFRFYGVGEYGEEGFRPHFHVVTFGLSWLRADLVQKAWSWKGKPMGFVHGMELNPHTAAYVCGYIAKKWTTKQNEKLEGRHPEFSRMSNRPYGIGGGAIPEMAAALSAYNSSLVDVPREFHAWGKKMPLGSYLHKKLRVALGRSDKQPQVLKKALAEVRAQRTPEEKRKLEVKRNAAYEVAVARQKLSNSRKKL